MKRILTTFLILGLLLGGVPNVPAAPNQNRAPTLRMGFPAIAFTSSAQSNLSAAATWLAFQFVPNQTKSLSSARLFLFGKTGTPTAAGCTCDLYSDNNGVPNASLESVAADSVPAAGNWMNWTFAGTSSVTAGTAYWLVFKNGTGTPASNFPGYQWSGTANRPTLPVVSNSNFLTSTLAYGWNKATSTDTGSTWTSRQNAVGGPRIGYSDSTYEGFPAGACTTPGSGATADRAFGKSEVGVKFNVPAGVTYNILGVWFMVSKTSTPGALRFRLYQGVTLLGTTNGIAAASVATSPGECYTDYFSTPISVVSTNQPFRVVMGDATSGDTNTAGYNGQIFTFENDANSLALKPMNGTLSKTITSDNTANPVVFTDTTTDILSFELLMDTNGELTPGSSGVPMSRIRTGF